MRPDESHKQSVRPERPLVLYDGDCMLCNRSVRFIINHGGRDAFRFMPLSEYNAKESEMSSQKSPDSLWLFESGVWYSGADAVLRIASFLTFPWQFLSWLKLIPRFIRNPLYRWVARNRHHEFLSGPSDKSY